MKLNELQIGDTATILSVGGSGALRQHFLDMGLIQLFNTRPWGIQSNCGFTDMN